MVRILGADISLNHGAVVLIENGKLIDFAYFTDAAGSANRPGGKGTRLSFPKNEDKQVLQQWRLAFVESWFRSMLKKYKPDYVGLEDYALRSEHQAHQLGEAGGVCKLAMWKLGIPFRLSDPISSKMFVTHDGLAQKDLVEREVKTRWGVDFSEYNVPYKERFVKNKKTGKTKKTKPNRTTSEDLADAFGLAQLVRAEVRLRSGKLVMSKLHPKEIRVFNRVTKPYPINILAREFIQRPELRVQ